MAYSNGKLTDEQVKTLQNVVGATADGKWGTNSTYAAGGLSADEAWSAYQNGTLGKTSTTSTTTSGAPTYTSPYGTQITDLYNKIANRDKFSYDLNGDALYKQYQQNYTRLGQQAMADTMGQAAGLTGGYGSSYSQRVGNEAYNNYLTQLNDIVPDLYNQAYSRYTQEGTDMYNQLSALQSLESDAYQKYRDAVSDYQWQQDYNLSLYNKAGSGDDDPIATQSSLEQDLADMKNEGTSIYDRLAVINAAYANGEITADEATQLKAITSSTGYVSNKTSNRQTSTGTSTLTKSEEKDQKLEAAKKQYPKATKFKKEKYTYIDSDGNKTSGYRYVPVYD